MKKFLSLLAMLLVAASAWSLPFEPTSDASDPSTKWYYIKTGDHYMFADSDDGLAPSTNATIDDHYQWCFVGNETHGYNIYNRGTGGFIAGGAVNGTTSSSNLSYVQLTSGNSFYIYFVVRFGQTSQTLYIRYDSSFGAFFSDPSPSAFTAVEVTPPIPPTEQPYEKLTPIDFYLPFNANNAGHEGFNKLIDQNKYTKWCVVNDGGGWETIWMEFMSDAWFIPNGYILTTGDDTQSCPNRNPKEWVLYGKTFADDEWTELAHVTNGGGLEAKNTTDYTFPITGVTQGCRHFRFEVRQINGKEAGSNNYTFQLAELALSGTRVTPPEPSGNIVFSDLDVQDHYCTLSVSYSGDEEHQLTLKVNGETVENPYTITRTNEVQTLQVQATVTFTDGYNPLTTSITYEIPALEGTEPVTEFTLTATAAHTPNNVQTDPAEDYHKLFDKNKSTKWCVDNSTGSWETIWVDFKSNTPFFPTGYTMTTGNDTQSWKGRNPKKWKIYAKARESDDWTTIVDVTDGAAEGLGTNNTTDYSFDINGVSKKYQYFRFEVSEVCGKGGWQSDHYVFQLAELALSGTLEGTEPVTVTGDLTGDGLVDIADVNAVINMMLGKASPTAVGDVTGDGTVDIADVNAVINIMLGKTTPVTPPVVDPTPQTLTATGYNIPHNNLSNEGNEGYAKLVDGDRTTKWCMENRSGAWETIWIDLKSNVSFKPTSYIMTTGNDTQSFIARNPKKWKIYGRNSESESWTELVHVTDGAGLGTANTTDYTFQFNGITKAYKYYRFEVIEIGGEDHWNSNYYIFQLGELTLVGVAQ